MYNLWHNEDILASSIVRKILELIPVVQASMRIISMIITIRWIWLVTILMILVISVVLILQNVQDRIMLPLYWSDRDPSSSVKFHESVKLPPILNLEV